MRCSIHKHILQKMSWDSDAGDWIINAGKDVWSEGKDLFKMGKDTLEELEKILIVGGGVMLLFIILK